MTGKQVLATAEGGESWGRWKTVGAAWAGGVMGVGQDNVFEGVKGS